MSEVDDILGRLISSHPTDLLLNDTSEHNRKWYDDQASIATRDLMFPEIRIVEKDALFRHSESFKTESEATQAEFLSYWMGVTRQRKKRGATEALVSQVEHLRQSDTDVCSILGKP
jgi:hypothetical protein